jgi:hypothetical protein
MSAEWKRCVKRAGAARAHVKHGARIDTVGPALVVDVARVGDTHIEPLVRFLVAVGRVRHGHPSADVAEQHRLAADVGVLHAVRIVAVLVGEDAAAGIDLGVPRPVAIPVAAVDGVGVVQGLPASGGGLSVRL